MLDYYADLIESGGAGDVPSRENRARIRRKQFYEQLANRFGDSGVGESNTAAPEPAAIVDKNARQSRNRRTVAPIAVAKAASPKSAAPTEFATAAADLRTDSLESVAELWRESLLGITAVPEKQETIADDYVVQLTGISLPNDGLERNWPDIITDPIIEVGGHNFVFETIGNQAANHFKHQWVYGVAKFNGEPQQFAAHAELILAFCQKTDPDMGRLPDNSTDLALILEYFLRRKLEQIEASTNSTITVENARIVELLPEGDWLFLAVSDGEKAFEGAILPGPLCRMHLAQFAVGNSYPGEKRISHKLVVKLGPIALPREAIQALGAECQIDCGIDPNQAVSGMLQRSDGKFWPITFAGDEISITGELTDLSEIEAGDGYVAASLEIGYLFADHNNRINFAAGQEFVIERIEGDQAIFWVGNRSVGAGSMYGADDTLVILLDEWNHAP